MLNMWMPVIAAYNYLNDLLVKLLGWSLRDGWWTGQPDGFERCAHRQRVLMGVIDPNTTWTSLDTYALRHVSYEDPVAAVLEDDRVSLMGLTTEKAYFAVVPRGTDVYDIRGTFVTRVQFANARELITMSLPNFVKLSKELDGKSKAKILLLSNTSRCGSTLLTAMLEGLDHTVCMSEPDFLTHISILGNSLSVPVEHVLRAGFVLQCKPLCERTVELFVVKTRGFSVGLVPSVAKACPHVRHAYQFRNPRGTIMSNCGLLSVSRWKSVLPAMADHMTVDGSNHVSDIHDLTEKVLENLTPVGLNSAFWALNVLCFKESRDLLKIDVLPVSYEELLKDPEELIRKLVAHCGHQHSGSMDKCLEAMSRDSQENSVLSQEKLKKSKRLEKFTEEEELVINSNFEKLGLPPLEFYLQTFKGTTPAT